MEGSHGAYQPTPHLLTHFDLRPNEVALTCPSVDELVDRIDSLDADGFLKGVRPKHRNRLHITAHDIKDRQYDCERLLITLPAACDAHRSC